jgi:hypothetical protein
MKVVRLSASSIGRLYPWEMFLVLIFTRGWVDARAVVRSEGNMSLKNPVTSPGIEPGTVRLVAQHLNHYATPGPRIIPNTRTNFSATRNVLILYLFFLLERQGFPFNAKSDRVYRIVATCFGTSLYVARLSVVVQEHTHTVRGWIWRNALRF